MIFFKTSFFLTILLLISCKSKEQAIVTNINEGAILSAIKGVKSKPYSITYKSKKKLSNIKPFISGKNAEFFKIQDGTPKEINANINTDITVYFHPSKNFIGIAKAKLELQYGNNKSKIVFPLRGLSSKALEGENEPSLSIILKTLNYKINIGWESLTNHVNPQLQGDEIKKSKFKKSGINLVEMIPIARYSPSFKLPYGYYTVKDSIPELHEVNELLGSKLYYEHQTLFPTTKTKRYSFDPKDSVFGFYTTSPSHNAYTEDIWNKLYHKKQIGHATRIYELKNASGEVVSNQYLICFEEAQNGDYQDYVFIIKNIEPVK